MEGKKSIGVTIFGCLFITFPIIALFFIKISSPMSLLVCLLMLICGIGILRRLSWARKLTIWTALLQIFLGLKTFFITLMLPAIFKQAVISEGLDVASKGVMTSGKAVTQLQGIMVIMLFISIVFWLGIIYFFTRPRIKEEFK